MPFSTSLNFEQFGDDDNGVIDREGSITYEFGGYLDGNNSFDFYNYV